MTTEFGTSYFGVRDVEHARKDLERFSNNGLNGILHTFSERDRAYYQDTLREIVRASQNLGFNVYVNPWGVGRVFGGEALSEFPSRFPGHTQRLSNGDRTPASCLNSPRFRDFMHRWIEDAVSLSPDVIFWDEPHWHTPGWRSDGHENGAWTCTCEYCRDKFEKKHDRTFPDQPTDTFTRFRERCLLDFLDEMMASTAQHEVNNAVCVMPELNNEDVITDWNRLASNDDLDVLATTPYWKFHDKNPETFVRTWSNRIIELADKHDLTSQVWIQGFDLGDGDEQLECHRMAAETAVDCNPDSLFLWGWDGCGIMSSIACDDPGKVWSIYLDIIESAR